MTVGCLGKLTKIADVQPGALPTGTVAFLFSDIEGSTRRWDADRDAMEVALRRHDAILQTQAQRRRGYVFKTMGDAFCIAFSSVEEALEAAVDVQRRLGREDFDQVGGLAVRMAIHAGESDERAGDYFGPAVNRTARLLSAGHGGQILLTGFAAELAMRRMPPGIGLRHLGVLPLRDLKEPESVFQAIVSGLQSEFKPLRSLKTPPNNLPRQTTSFVGRERDAARLGTLLDGGGLVTVVGAGGIGKTRLALQVAAARLNDEPDGVWFVDLSAITTAELVSGAILSSLGAQRSGEADSLDELLGYLELRALLLILDNSEHIVSEMAPIVSAIVAKCPHLTVLATSRAPLDITAERIYRLATLGLAGGIQLFTDRAVAVNPRFDAGEDAAAIENICRRLDGIALAIELAAARMRMMSAKNLVAHLELRLLAGGRDRRPRQQTMRALIDWSYDLLEEREKAMLQRCAVFARGFFLGAASAVCAGDVEEWDAFELLASLVDKSLVVAEGQDGDERYRLLEPIREYAFEKLRESGALAEVQRRHANAFALLASNAYEQWDTGPQADWLSRLETDLGNIRLALRWTLEEGNDPALGAQLVADIAPVWLRLALLAEGAQWCERALETGIGGNANLEARLRYGLSMLYSNIGANDKVLEHAMIAVSLYRQTDDSRGLARALSQVASRQASLGRYEEANDAAQEALKRARDPGDRRLLADTLRRCAEALAGDGIERVREAFEESVTLFRSLGRADETARALGWWGQWEAGAGNFEVAAQRLLEAKALETRDVAVMFFANDIASCYLATGDISRAEPYAREALGIAVQARHQLLSAMAISHLAVVTASSDVPKATRLIGYAEEALRAARWRRVPYEQLIVGALLDRLKTLFTESELSRLLAEGGAWTAERAVSEALSR